MTPVVDPAAYVHPSATLIGDVIVGPGAYIGPSASLRGDFGRIVVGPGANVQDCCMVHSFPGTDALIDEDGHVGHGAVIHAARVCRGALIGMNAVINDGAVIGEYAIVAALAFVKANTTVPARHLVAGIPARVLRELTEEEIAWKRDATRQYQELALRSLRTMTETEALPAVEPDRRRLDLGEVIPLAEWKAKYTAGG
jgi:phenylacetic acid degradation protein